MGGGVWPGVWVSVYGLKLTARASGEREKRRVGICRRWRATGVLSGLSSTPEPSPLRLDLQADCLDSGVVWQWGWIVRIGIWVESAQAAFKVGHFGLSSTHPWPEREGGSLLHPLHRVCTSARITLTLTLPPNPRTRVLPPLLPGSHPAGCSSYIAWPSASPRSPSARHPELATFNPCLLTRTKLSACPGTIRLV